MTKTLYIIRGLPGTGKSTLGEKLADSYMDYHPTKGGLKIHSYAADDFFYDDQGVYNYVPQLISQAHQHCHDNVRDAMISQAENICVCNTFTQAWEAEAYFKLCDDNKYTAVVLHCQTEFGNVHDCPQDKIDEMAARWDHSIDPRCSGRWDVQQTG